MRLHDVRIQMQQRISAHRRETGAISPEAFAQAYLTSHCTSPPSRMHREIFQALTRLMQRRDGRLAVAAPRGHAKSTIVSLVFVLWCALYRKEKFILIISATKDQADAPR